ncbi:MAG TPA: hypothetical protein VK453_29175 [Micromonosporaceae bacterium]|nr:hypothetical protein [Micromonosporaceae bacterium]
MRIFRVPAVLGVSLVLVAGLASAAQADPPETRHRSGIVIVPSTDPPVGEPISDALGQLLHEAADAVEARPEDLAYPWYDRASNAVVVDTVNDQGDMLAAGLVGARGGLGAVTRNRRVPHSWAKLQSIKDEAIALTATDVPDGDAIFMTEPDPEHNRVVIYTTRMSDEFLDALAERYGTSAVAVRHMPGQISSTGDARNNDTSPFYGGARIDSPSGCTTGFSWRSGAINMMLTAGHCVPGGGTLHTPVAVIGPVAPNSRENWKPGTGTVYLTGQTTYRGDVALATVTSPRTSGASIYRGGPGASVSARVAEMWSRRPATNDRYCTGGHVTGEKCGWSVYRTGINFRWSSGELARNMVRSFYRTDTCTIGGDSGGPVYTVRADGRIAAKGIHHGKSTMPVFGCMEVFTDIWDAYYALPGSLATG